MGRKCVEGRVRVCMASPHRVGGTQCLHRNTMGRIHIIGLAATVCMCVCMYVHSYRMSVYTCTLCVCTVRTSVHMYMYQCSMYTWSMYVCVRMCAYVWMHVLQILEYTRVSGRIVKGIRNS
jgi:hypothetical protein